MNAEGSSKRAIMTPKTSRRVATTALVAAGCLLLAACGGFLLDINGPTVDSATDHGLAQEKVLAAAILGRM